ncbi:MAG: PEP-CTERM sorting domain-containing protein [Microcoleaceae cyanobacterium MO_207.B10]|nr:PEP-CTERM sorting domain-containing protein [Microcoleaceae cyanobacterium MO_207.B10]
MLNLLQKKTITLSSSLAVTFGGLLVPVNMAQAAVFKFTIDGLDGSGYISFDDESVDISVERVIVQGSDLNNGYFDWSFGGTASAREDIYECGYYYYPGYGEYYNCGSYRNYSERVTLDSDMAYWSGSGFSAFDDADFIFEKGELVGIDNYSVDIDYDWLSGWTYSSFWLNYPSAGLSYHSLDYIDYRNHWIQSDLNHSGSQQFSTIVPWKNPNPPVEKVPEPSTVFALVGIGLLLNKKKRSLGKNS